MITETAARLHAWREDLTAAVSATEPDWSRETKGFLEWSPGKSLLATIRAYQRLEGRSFAKLRRIPLILQHRFWSAVTGTDIPLNCQIGGGLLLIHTNGIVIHPGARIGPNCLIFQQVAVGITAANETPPVIGGHVDIGAGAKILGAIRIGDHARIGANAVVLEDIPSGATAVGIPAKVVTESTEKIPRVKIV